jgi:hypothetical protein
MSRGDEIMIIVFVLFGLTMIALLVTAFLSGAGVGFLAPEDPDKIDWRGK